jgi:hypothetical protein
MAKRKRKSVLQWNRDDAPRALAEGSGFRRRPHPQDLDELWQRVDELQSNFEHMAEVSRDLPPEAHDELHEIALTLLSFPDRPFRDLFREKIVPLVKAHIYPKLRSNRRYQKEQAQLAVDAIQHRLDDDAAKTKEGREALPLEIAKTFVDHLFLLEALHHRAPDAPVFGVGRWDEDYKVAVDLVTDALRRLFPDDPDDPKLPDADRVGVAAMQALGCTEGVANDLFRNVVLLDN